MPRVCDFCFIYDAILFCRADAAFLCSACDLKVHQANKVASRHERALICNGCELVLPDFICRADIAALCSACTIKVRSTHPQDRQHEQSQLVPLYAAPYAAGNDNADMGFNTCAHITSHGNILDHIGVPDMGIIRLEDGTGVVDDKLFVSWLVPHDPKFFDSINDDKLENAGMESRKGLMEWEEENFRRIESFMLSEPCEESVCVHAEDSLVPSLVHTSSSTSNAFRTDEAAYTQGIVSESGSLTSAMAMHVAPDFAPNCMRATERPCLDDLSHLCNTLAREARVLRYREKRKNRNFEKTVRYASRKAYAEARPRLNGRFAKHLFEVSKQSL